MNKTITTALLILASGLTLSTTALAEPFTHGSGYVNYRNYDEGPESLAEFRKRQSEVRFSTHVQSSTISGFNNRSSVEDQESTVGSRTDAKTSNSDMLTLVSGGFNDRG